MTNRRGRLTRRSSVQLEHLLEEEKTFKLPKFIPLSTRYKKIEEKKEKEEKIKLLREKNKKKKKEEEENENIGCLMRDKEELAMVTGWYLMLIIPGLVIRAPFLILTRKNQEVGADTAGGPSWLGVFPSHHRQRRCWNFNQNKNISIYIIFVLHNSLTHWIPQTFINLLIKLVKISGWGAG